MPPQVLPLDGIRRLTSAGILSHSFRSGRSTVCSSRSCIECRVGSRVAVSGGEESGACRADICMFLKMIEAQIWWLVRTQCHAYRGQSNWFDGQIFVSKDISEAPGGIGKSQVRTLQRGREKKRAYDVRGVQNTRPAAVRKRRQTLVGAIKI